jgi:hypothetical protein
MANDDDGGATCRSMLGIDCVLPLGHKLPHVSRHQRDVANATEVTSRAPGSFRPARLFRFAVAAALFGAAIAVAAPAHASGRCLFQGDWDCYGSPQWNGPQLNTWDVPGPIDQPVICSPYTYQCSAVAVP